MVQKAHKLHQIVMNATTIKGIVDQKIINTVTQEVLQGGGSLDPYNIATLKSEQAISFGTKDLKVFLDLCGISGYTISSSAQGKLYFRQLADGGTYTGSTNDTYILINKGLLHFTSISCQQFQAAVLSAMIIPTFDGTNLPCVLNNSTAAPTLARDTAVYTLGGLTVNGTAIPIQSANVELGLGLELMGADGSVYNTEVFIVRRNPKITCTLKDAQVMATIAPFLGKAVGGDVILYFRKYSMGGGYVANNTEEHIKITVKDGQISSDGIDGNNGGIAGLGITITPAYNATDAIIGINTAAAIT